MIILLLILFVIFVVSLSFFVYIQEKKRKNFIITQYQREIDNYNQMIELQKENFKNELELYTNNIKLQKEQLEQNFNVAYNTALSAHQAAVELLDENYNEKEKEVSKSITELQHKLDSYKHKVDTINNEILRQREIDEKRTFYTINLTDNDIFDIKLLKNTNLQLKNSEILNKLIYETYIRKPLLELVKRLTQGKKVTGIYKITYKSGESYIGRSTDIGKRFQEHCKSSLNIGSIAHSTFHNVLADKGLENFTFEILEEAGKESLPSREAYWINFYGTREYGFNERRGG